MFASEIDLIDIESDPALRSGLEAMGARVNRFPVAQARHWIEVLERPEPAPFLVISAHGDSDGILIPELTPELQRIQPFSVPVGPNQIRAGGRVDGSVVLCLACCSGRADLAAAWLEIGAASYIAPDGYPEASDALVFALVLFWRLLCARTSLEQAFKETAALGGSTEIFRLHSAS